MRMAPGKDRDHLCWWPLIFNANHRAWLENDPERVLVSLTVYTEVFD